MLRGTTGTGKSRLARWLCERAHELGLPAIALTEADGSAMLENTAAPTGTGAMLMGFGYRKLTDGRYLDGVVTNNLLGGWDSYHRAISFNGNPGDFSTGIAIGGSDTDWHVMIVYRQSNEDLRVWDEDGLVTTVAGANDPSALQWALRAGAYPDENSDSRTTALIRAEDDEISDRQIAYLLDYLARGTSLRQAGTTTDIDGDG